MDGSPPVRLGEGVPMSVSPDGRWVLSIRTPSTDPKLWVLPTGAGEPRSVTAGGLAVKTAEWFSDGKRVLLTAAEQGRGDRLYTLDGLDAKPHAISPLGYRAFLHTISSDDRFAAAQGPDGRRYLYPLSGGEPTPLPGLVERESPVGWTADGWLFVFDRGKLPGRVYRLEFSTGKRELWRELVPLDPAGIDLLSPPALTPDGKTYVYSYNRILSDLFLADGLK